MPPSGSSTYTARFVGTKFSSEFRVFFENGEKKLISPFHDIPLKTPNGFYNMVCEIPRWTNAKFEIATGEPLNPIKQDIKKGQIRFVKNIFPHRGYIWNYGALPQTWEDPNHTDVNTGCNGDNDPIDAIEIGQRIAKTGEVKEVKVLGVVALLDEGETDWKIIVIDTRDALAKEMNDLEDIERLLPGLLDATLDWFRFYKVAEGKDVNKIAFDGKAKGSKFAKSIIDETHVAWKRLMDGSVPAKTETYNLSIQTGDCFNGSSFTHEYTTGECTKENPLDEEIHKSFYIDRSKY